CTFLCLLLALALSSAALPTSTPETKIPSPARTDIAQRLSPPMRSLNYTKLPPNCSESGTTGTKESVITDSDVDANDKLPPMDPEKGSFCVLGGGYPYYGYGYYNPYSYYYRPWFGFGFFG
ncbi:hypothetical protein OSTOST_24560, partial [Ostertagia ostertagi]